VAKPDALWRTLARVGSGAVVVAGTVRGSKLWSSAEATIPCDFVACTSRTIPLQACSIYDNDVQFSFLHVDILVDILVTIINVIVIGVAGGTASISRSRRPLNLAIPSMAAFVVVDAVCVCRVGEKRKKKKQERGAATRDAGKKILET